MSGLKYSYKVITGDRSGDGHCMSETIHIMTNYARSYINDAYGQSVGDLGIDLHTDVCAEYEDASISKEHADILLDSGIPLGKLCYEVHDGGETLRYNPLPLGMVRMYMEMAKLKLPLLKYEIVGDNVPDLFDRTIGYGTFI